MKEKMFEAAVKQRKRYEMLSPGTLSHQIEREKFEMLWSIIMDAGYGVEYESYERIHS